MALQSIGPVSDFPINKGVCLEFNGRKISVFNSTGQYYAIDDTCPHRGASFASGTMVGTTVRCPWHGAEVDVRTGVCGPPAGRPVNVYDISSDGKQLFIDLG